MKYEAIIRPANSLEIQGKRQEALKKAKELKMKITYENNGFYVLTSPMEAVIYERDDYDKIIRQADPYPYIMNSHPEYKRITEKRIEKLVDCLNEGKIDFNDVFETANNN